MSQRRTHTARWWVMSIALISTLALTPLVAEAGPNPAPVALRKADSFAVLAGAGITNAGESTVTGDMGTFPTMTSTGTAPCPATNCINLTGTDHVGDAVTQAAKNDLVTAYNDAAGRAAGAPIGTELGGTTVAPGVYTSGSGTFEITGTLRLDGQGDSNSVFIFQMPSTLTTATSSQVTLVGGAQACNVFWQVGSSATLGTNSTFKGSVLAYSSITATTNVAVMGRLLASNGQVTMDANTVRRPACARANPLFKPDAMVSAAGGPFVGNNVYNSTGANQVVSQEKAAGRAANFVLRVQNDGTASTDTIWVDGTLASPGFVITVFDGTQDVSAAFRAGTLSKTLAPGAFADLRIRIRIKDGTAHGKVQIVRAVLTSGGDGTKTDTAIATVTCRHGHMSPR